MSKSTAEQIEAARQRAEAQFAKAKAGAEAMTDYQAEAKALDARTDRLRAERLAREAGVVQPEIPSPKGTRTRR